MESNIIEYNISILSNSIQALVLRNILWEKSLRHTNGNMVHGHIFGGGDGHHFLIGTISTKCAH